MGGPDGQGACLVSSDGQLQVAIMMRFSRFQDTGVIITAAPSHAEL